ncbi:unnamed protein product [Didymodactylos carnosus]|uniref:Uncharacterized protein n=1 Tax=Didymodactylos carnosus TaxID=1234261 RepID=A0A8S2TFU1_9BILA|nr:unnamed protein product [Didymodactylos carnosus]CAF4288250.1 unnamed protein product [Didymodactylos carnosus]
MVYPNQIESNRRNSRDGIVNQRRNINVQSNPKDNHGGMEVQNSYTSMEPVTHGQLIEILAQNSNYQMQQWQSGQYPQLVQNHQQQPIYEQQPLYQAIPSQNQAHSALQQRSPRLFDDNQSKKSKTNHNLNLNEFNTVESQMYQNQNHALQHANQNTQQYAQQQGQNVSQYEEQMHHNVQQGINWNLLKYAISHDLPPFVIKFEDEEKLSRDRLPGAMHVKSFIQKDLWKAGVKFQGFSLIRPVNKRFKLYVNNREDYHKLLISDKWPGECCGKTITVLKP